MTMTRARHYKYYVGRKLKGPFARVWEEQEGEEFAYCLIRAHKKPTRRSHPEYHLVVGPFRTKAIAKLFRDVEGLNTVEESEMYLGAEEWQSIRQ